MNSQLLPFDMRLIQQSKDALAKFHLKIIIVPKDSFGAIKNCHPDMKYSSYQISGHQNSPIIFFNLRNETSIIFRNAE